MDHWFQLVGPQRAVEIFGVRLVGINYENAVKLGLSVILVVLIVLIARLARWITHVQYRTLRNERSAFWARQTTSVASALAMLIGLMSIWFDEPTKLTTAMGLVTAGLAFALQRVVTALAGYIVILRGSTFNVGDRITMGGVRGDVIALGFLNTTIMEMGQPPAVQNADPAMWVRARQYSGRIVTVTNAKIFDDPVYNYTRDFPYIWEEIAIPIPYRADRQRAEAILLEAARKHAISRDALPEDAVIELQRRYFIRDPDIRPRVFMRLTDNWTELAVRFLCKDHEIREVKDAMSREILGEFNAAKIEIASTTTEIVGVPELHVAIAGGSQSRPQQ